jgi:hypothetical protein
MVGGRVGVLVAVAAVVVASAACGGKGGEKFVPVHAEASTSVNAQIVTTAPPATLHVLTDEEAARHLEQLLEQNAGARAQVSQAVQGVGSCSVDPHQAYDTLGAVVNTRKALVDQVNATDAHALAEGDVLKGNLIQAWQASIAADVHFQAWALGVANGGCTRNGVNNGPEWDAAGAASAQATASKQAFSDLWAPVAARFGLRAWAENEL